MQFKLIFQQTSNCKYKSIRTMGKKNPLKQQLYNLYFQKPNLLSFALCGDTGDTIRCISYTVILQLQLNDAKEHLAHTLISCWKHSKFLISVAFSCQSIRGLGECEHVCDVGFIFMGNCATFLVLMNVEQCRICWGLLEQEYVCVSVLYFETRVN